MADLNELSWMERNGISPGKAILIAVLGIVFLAVVGYQTMAIVFRGEPQEQATALLKPVVKKVVKLAADSLAGQPPKREAVPTWPDMPLEETLRHDPFRLPAAIQAALAENRPQRTSAGGGDPAAGPGAASGEAAGEDAALESRRAERLAQMKQKGADVVIVGRGAAVAVIDGVELRVGDVIDGLRIEKIGRLGIDLVEVEPTP